MEIDTKSWALLYLVPRNWNFIFQELRKALSERSVRHCNNFAISSETDSCVQPIIARELRKMKENHWNSHREPSCLLCLTLTLFLTATWKAWNQHAEIFDSIENKFKHFYLHFNSFSLVHIGTWWLSVSRFVASQNMWNGTVIHASESSNSRSKRMMRKFLWEFHRLEAWRWLHKSQKTSLRLSRFVGLMPTATTGKWSTFRKQWRCLSFQNLSGVFLPTNSFHF